MEDRTERYAGTESHRHSSRRLLKLFGLSVIVLSVIILLLSLLIPSHIRISRATNIGSREGAVLNYVKDTAQWKNWHPVFMPSDSMPASLPIMIVPQKITADEIIMVLSQGDKRPVVNGWKLHPVSADSTVLQWYMDFNMGWLPWQKFGSLFYESTYGAMIEKGLSDLKSLQAASRN